MATRIILLVVLFFSGSCLYENEPRNLHAPPYWKIIDFTDEVDPFQPGFSCSSINSEAYGKSINNEGENLLNLNLSFAESVIECIDEENNMVISYHAISNTGWATTYNCGFEIAFRDQVYFPHDWPSFGFELQALMDVSVENAFLKVRYGNAGYHAAQNPRVPILSENMYKYALNLNIDNKISKFYILTIPDSQRRGNTCDPCPIRSLNIEFFGGNTTKPSEGKVGLKKVYLLKDEHSIPDEYLSGIEIVNLKPAKKMFWNN